MSKTFIDLISDIPKYVPFNYKIKEKDSGRTYDSELLILNYNNIPISLKTGKEHCIKLNSNQTMSIKYCKEYVEYNHIEDLIDCSKEQFGTTETIYSGVFVFFTNIYNDTNSYKPSRIIQVLKKIDKNWYEYDNFNNKWSLINIYNNVLVIPSSIISHKYICVEYLSTKGI